MELLIQIFSTKKMKKKSLKILASAAITLLLLAGVIYTQAEEPKPCPQPMGCSSSTSCLVGYNGKYVIGQGTFCCEQFPVLVTGHHCIYFPPPED